jgi:phage tail sheath gpL-like
MINTGLSPNDVAPGVRNRHIYSQGGRGLVPLPRRMVMIGTMKAGTAVAGQLYEVNDLGETDALFGIGTPLSIGCRKAIDCAVLENRSPQLFAIGMAEYAAGTARTHTFTFGGTATAAGQVFFWIKGVRLSIGVSVGNTPTDLASAVVAQVNANLRILPVTATNAAGVVTFVANVKGDNGNDIIFSYDNRLPAGITLASAAVVAGVGQSDMTGALAAIAGQDFDAIAVENHKTADITLGVTHVTAAWLPTEQAWRWIFYGENGSIGTAAALASAANHRAIVVACCEQSPSTPFEIAIAVGFKYASAGRPNANFNEARLPLAPPPASYNFTTSQVNTAILSGVTALRGIVDRNTRSVTPGVLAIKKMVTTVTTVDGQPSRILLDIAVPSVAAYMSRQYEAGYSTRFSADRYPDGVLFTDDTIRQFANMVATIHYAAEAVEIIRDVDDDLPKIQYERDGGNANQLNLTPYYTVVVGLDRAALVHYVQVGG